MNLKIVDITQQIETLAATSKVWRKIVERYYISMVKNEVDFSHIKDTDKVLCIGGGPYPCTALLIHKLTGAQVDVIDNDYESVKRAVKLVGKLGLSKKVDILYKNGEEVDVTGYQVIHLALQVHPKEVIFNNIKTQMDRGSKLLMRIPKPSCEKWYSKVLDVVEYERKEHVGCGNTKYTVMYIRK